jgi:hypothetical protein
MNDIQVGDTVKVIISVNPKIMNQYFKVIDVTKYAICLEILTHTYWMSPDCVKKVTSNQVEIKFR